MRLIWTDRATQKRLGIIKYVWRDNPDAARKLNTSINEAAKKLLQFPEMGRPGVIEGTREIVIRRNYILVYRIGDNCIYILTVHHAAQNYQPERRTD